MAKIAILGASAMGSALCRPLVDVGWEVNLWGTSFDDDLISLYKRGEPHPVTKVPLAPGVRLFSSKNLDKATSGVEVVALAVASPGLVSVTEMAAEAMSRARCVWLTTKGLVEEADGRVLLLTEAMEQVAAKQGVKLPALMSIGGPVIARQCALAKPTATVFASAEYGPALYYAKKVRTASYCPLPIADITGLEILAAFKNIYAIGLGVTEGMEESSGLPQSNLRAAVFAQATQEMAVLCQAAGGRPETSAGLAGVGDLEVTGISGRNKFYGMRLGRGENPQEALDRMVQAGQTVEGMRTAQMALKLVDQRFPELWNRLPLLKVLCSAVMGQSDIRQSITGAALPGDPDLAALVGEAWSKEWDPRRRLRLPWSLARLFKR